MVHVLCYSTCVCICAGHHSLHVTECLLQNKSPKVERLGTRCGYSGYQLICTITVWKSDKTPNNPVWSLKKNKQLDLILYIMWYFFYIKGNLWQTKRKYTMSMYTQSEKKGENKRQNIILHFTWSYEQKHNTPYIVICDLSTVLDLRPLHSFTYDTVYWYSHTFVYRIAL